MEWLTDLSRSFSLGIVTNGTIGWQLDKIEVLGIKSLFSRESIIISEEIGFEKPAREIFVRALERLSAHPDEVLFVGDSWKNDVEGPMRAGIRSIWYNKKNEAMPEGVRPYGVIHHIFQIREYL